MVNKEMLTSCLKKYCDTIEQTVENCENGSKILIRIDNECVSAHNALVVQGVIGTIIGKAVSNMIAQAGGLIGQLLTVGNFKEPIEIQVTKTNDIVSVLCNFFGDSITEHVDEARLKENKSRNEEMHIEPYDMEAGMPSSQVNKKPRMEKILIQQGMSSIVKYLDDTAFLTECLMSRQQQNPHKDIQWIIDNL